MQSSVPQYIDIEDKIVGPFTWKHLGWLFSMGAVLLVMYAFFDFQLFLIAGIPSALLFLAFAFYRPVGMSMTKFVFHGFFFLFRPKLFVWERPVKSRSFSPISTKHSDTAVVQSTQETRVMHENKLKALAAILDRRSIAEKHR